MEKALLVVSFGTSFKETREKTICALEQDLRDAFPDRAFYNCVSLENVVISASVESIGSEAFRNTAISARRKSITGNCSNAIRQAFCPVAIWQFFC